MTMSGICDICGKKLTHPEIKILSGPVVWKATSNGYVPANLPATWKVPGVDLASHWKGVVATNKKEDWGLCVDCAKEVGNFHSHLSSAQEERGIAPELKARLADLFQEFSMNTDADAFWAQARRLGPYSKVLAAMSDLQSAQSFDSEQMAATAGAVLAMQRISHSTWDEAYYANSEEGPSLTASNQREPRNTLIVRLGPCINHFIRTGKSQRFYSEAENLCTPKEAVEAIIVFAAKYSPRSRGRWSLRSFREEACALIADIRQHFYGDSWEDLAEPATHAQLSNTKRFALNCIMAEQQIEAASKQQDLGSCPDEDAAPGRSCSVLDEDVVRLELLRVKLGPVLSSVSSAQDKLKQMEAFKLFKRRPSKEDMMSQREFLANLIKEKCDTERELRIRSWSFDYFFEGVS